jgi:hypothetical protein
MVERSKQWANSFASLVDPPAIPRLDGAWCPVEREPPSSARAGDTRGWRNHPQLDRFKDHSETMDAIGFYPLKIREEASFRGHSYDGSKIRRPINRVALTSITTGQLLYEFSLLLERTRLRMPAWHEKLREVYDLPKAYPLFEVVEGDVGRWEVSYWRGGSASKGKANSHHAATLNSLTSS